MSIVYDEKRDVLIIEVKPDVSKKAISPSGKSFTSASVNEKITIKGEVVTVGLNAYITIPKSDRK